MAAPYGVVARSLPSHYGCYSQRTDIDVRPGSKQIPVTILQRALSFLDPVSWAAVPFVNKAFHQAARGKVFLLHLAQEEEVKGKLDSYSTKRTITREDAQAIFAQTGLEISFVPGQAQINHFHLGRGNFGAFCIAHAAQKAHYVGIKITRGRDASEQEAQTQLALSGLPCIMPTLDLCKAKDPTGSPALYQVMELGGLGSTATLKKHLDLLVDQPFKQQVLFCLTEGLLIGLAGMHRKGYYHFDMKPDNLVVRQDGQLFLIDFGCSVQSATPVIDTRQAIGDLTYFSPERGTVCNATKIDAWAAGITLLILGGFASLPTAKTFDEADLARQAFEVQAKDLRPPSGNSFLALVYALLHHDPAKRLSPAQAMHHTWFLEMQKASAEWRADTVAYLRELVQSLHRESRSGVGPQDLPLPHFAAYIERTALKDALQKLLLNPSTYERASVTVCQGMGGVGKTQFVTHLIHQRKVQQHFGLKLWFRGSDSRSQLETQIVLLARELRLVDDKASFEQAQQRLHQHLSSQTKPWLIVFDNADDPEILTPFLPPSGGHILITTRSTTWPEAIPIDVFSPDEAVALVEKLLQREEPLSKELCQELGYLPLGIVQACAFIRNQKLTVVAYLEQLRKDAALVERDERLFGKKLPNSMLSLWQATFQALTPEARALLDVVVYLAPENIPPILMQKLASTEARATLKQYALLQESAQGFCSIHRLVQLAVRSRQQKTDALIKGMAALYELYVLQDPNSQEMETNGQLFAHGEAMLAYAEQQVVSCPQLRAPFARMYILLGVQHGALAHPNQSCNLLEKALKMAQQAHGQDHPDIAMSLNYLGGAWRTLGDDHKALQCHEKALAIRQKIYGMQHPETAISLNNVGVALLGLGNYEKALGYFEQSRAINKAVYGTQHAREAMSLSNMGTSWEMLGDSRKALQLHEEALVIRRHLFGERHPGVAASLNDLGGAWEALGDAQKALQHYEQALAIYKKVYGEQHPHVATTLNNIGEAWRALGDAQKALQHYEKALAIYKKVYGEQHPHVATSLSCIGHACNALGDAQKALQHYEQALAILKKVYGEQHPGVAISLNNIGEAWRALGDAQKALQHYEQALAIYKKVYGEQHPHVATTLNNIGFAWHVLGDAQKALKHYEQAFAIRKKVYGEQHPEVATSLGSIGLAWHVLGDAQKALQHYEQAFAIRKKVYGEQHPEVATSLGSIGQAWNALGDAQKALQYYEQALAIRKKVYGEQHPEVAISLNNIGEAWRALGDAQKSLQHYEQALAIYKKVYGEQHPHVAISLNNIGLAWNALGDAQKALQHYEQALAINKKVYGEQHPEVATSLNNIGLAWGALGDAQKALQHYEQALAIYKKVYGEQHPHVANAFRNIACAWDTLEDKKKALQYYEQALDINQKVYGKQHPHIAASLCSIGSAYYKLGDWNRAAHYCNTAYQMALQLPSLGPDHPHTKIYKQWLDDATQPPEEEKQSPEPATPRRKKKKCIVM